MLRVSFGFLSKNVHSRLAAAPFHSNSVLMKKEKSHDKGQDKARDAIAFNTVDLQDTQADALLKQEEEESPEVRAKRLEDEQKEKLSKARAKFAKDREDIFRLKADKKQFVEVTHSIKRCPICTNNLKIDYKDVKLLSEFVGPNGAILPRAVTGVCEANQIKLKKAIKLSRSAGFMPYLGRLPFPKEL
eukprot:Colp12_sorted_trinity150504_noHs@17446